MARKRKAILTIGASGSGKSTWAKKFAAANQNWYVIERDIARKAIAPKEDPDANFWASWDFKNEQWVTELFDDMMQDIIDADGNIIVADTNLNPGHRANLIAKLESLDYEVSLEFFFVEYKKLLDYDNKRADSVGQQTVAKLYFQFMEQFGEQFGYKKLIKRGYDYPEAVIFDVDGTLAHMDRAKRSPYDWHLVGTDSMDEMVAEIAHHMYESGKRVIILSGRDSSCRNETIAWLFNNGIDFDEIYMRPEGDQRPDYVIKNELFQNHINGRFRVKAWFDDRPVVVRLGHALGVKMFAVGNQHLEF